MLAVTRKTYTGGRFNMIGWTFDEPVPLDVMQSLVFDNKLQMKVRGGFPQTLGYPLGEPYYNIPDHGTFVRGYAYEMHMTGSADTCKYAQPTKLLYPTSFDIWSMRSEFYHGSYQAVFNWELWLHWLPVFSAPRAW